MIISDTNILGSFAAADALPQLRELLGESVISIPPAVEDELRAGIAHRANHLQRVISAIEQGHISVLSLDEPTRALTTTRAGSAVAWAITTVGPRRRMG